MQRLIPISRDKWTSEMFKLSVHVDHFNTEDGIALNFKIPEEVFVLIEGSKVEKYVVKYFTLRG